MGDVRFTDLDVSFDVEKSTLREPNKCGLTVYNLGPDHRAQLEQLNTYRKTGPGRIRVVLEAGYQDPGPSLIFRGDLRNALSTQDPDRTWVTKIEGEDGGRAVLWSRVNRSFPAGTRVDTVVRACAEAMGVGVGNLDDVVQNLRLESGGAVFTEGTVLSGRAPEELDGVLRSVGLTWSVQDGVLQLLQRGQALQSTAVRLSADTGLVGAPTRTPDGTVIARMLMLPDVYPGRQVWLDTDAVRGYFRVKKAKYTGDSAGDAWYIATECLELVART